MPDLVERALLLSGASHVREQLEGDERVAVAAQALGRVLEEGARARGEGPGGGLELAEFAWIEVFGHQQSLW